MLSRKFPSKITVWIRFNFFKVLLRLMKDFFLLFLTKFVPHSLFEGHFLLFFPKFVFHSLYEGHFLLFFPKFVFHSLYEGHFLFFFTNFVLHCKPPKITKKQSDDSCSSDCAQEMYALLLLF